MIKPETALLISETALHISEHITEDEGRGVDSVKYEDVGGLHKEIKEIREIIDLPLKHPSLFNKLGITPQRGILLSGPPGCGKTLLARAVANENEAYFISINGPEIMSKFYGESEKRLQKIFINAEKKSPSIIFIDEIDAIAPKRDSTTGKAERRVVAQLLTLMNGFKRRGRVIVIGVTNKLELLEPALLSPGRFDRIIEIKFPIEKSREEIFGIHTRNMPLGISVSIQELAKNTQNFSGADISAVCKEAALFALNRLLPNIDLDSEEIDSKLLVQIEVNVNDFDKGIRKISRNIKIREKLIGKNNINRNKKF